MARRKLYERPVLAVTALRILYFVTEVLSESLARLIFGSNQGAGLLVKLGLFLATCLYSHPPADEAAASLT